MHEAPTGKKVVSDVPSNDGKEAVGFVCVDCKGKEPKFVVNTKGDEIDTERLENIPKVHTINVSEGVTISETVTATKEEE
jgi:hypothetical protein